MKVSRQKKHTDKRTLSPILKAKKQKRRRRSSSSSSTSASLSSSSTSSSSSSSISSSSSSESDEHKIAKRKGKKRARSSSSDTSSGSSANSSKKKLKRKGKKIKELKIRRKFKKCKKSSKSSSIEIDKTKRSTVQSDEDVAADVPLDLMNSSKPIAPMTKEQWEKQQSVVRRVYDESSGRHRLIKGDGEVIEEMVTKERHKTINKQATQGDGDYFQKTISSNTSQAKQ